MAIGSIADLVRRLRAALPRRWFPDDDNDALVLGGILAGLAAPWSLLYGLLQYTIKQSRITTASGVFLDIIAEDFFKTRISRRTSEPDSHFRPRIQAEILRPRATRGAVDQALTDLTGVHPQIFEPADTTDTGGYDLGGVGYNVAGGWGDLTLPFQAFITAFLPAGGGIANLSGYGNIAIGIPQTGSLGGYGEGAIAWTDHDMAFGAVTVDDIYATVAATLPAATIGWVRGLPASEAQVSHLQPIAGASRANSAARALFTVLAGRLIVAVGRSISTGRALSRPIANLFATGFAHGFGGLVPQAGVLRGRGTTQAKGRAALLVGGGILFGRSLASAIGRGQLAGLLFGRGIATSAGRFAGAALSAALAARGQASALGNSLFGNVIVLPGRGLTESIGRAALTVVRPLAARGSTKSAGAFAAPVLTGGLALRAQGMAQGDGVFGAPALAVRLSTLSQSESMASGGLLVQQAVPTPPANLVPSDATPTTMTLTWSPSDGA